MKENNTFFGANGHYSEVNATVGNNGSFKPEGAARSNMDYSIGYSSAALALIELAIESQEVRNSVDYLVYPICFNMRHAVELQLKELWRTLEELSKYREVALNEHRENKIKLDQINRGAVRAFPEVKDSVTHDIGIFWRLICEYAPIIDSRFSDIIELATEIITDIAEIDPTGQTFRYPASTESQIHLVDTPLINIIALKIRFECLIQILDFLDVLVRDIKYEYSWCKKTAHLSRFDIISAAYKMKPFLGQEKAYYKIAKKSIMQDFNISSNEYSKLIMALERDYSINGILSYDNKPKDLNFDDLVYILDIINALSPFRDAIEKSKSITTGFTEYVVGQSFNGEYVEEMMRRREAINNIISDITPEKLAELCALYDLSKEKKYTEIYHDGVKTNLKGINAALGDRSDLFRYINHYLEKTNFLEGIMSSLWSLNMVSIFNDLVSRYDLSQALWYPKLMAGYRHNSLGDYQYYNDKLAEIRERLIKEGKKIQYLRREG
ncbi:hypothetical protein SOM24_16760 [Pantoea agglomerans]|uniref:hypothetical protein n=1 Tax=Enterobacter agglomerans TaxID=549 RepID=UPI002A69F6B8|nr:hypothetical protein [Pantoea agglomerans]MDY1000124.1 hypothetical protein [Pantoea agglomerans]